MSAADGVTAGAPGGRTLVISDLHLGARRGGALLHRAEVLEALSAELPSFGRLVLLGDTIELRQGPLAAALTAAAPVLEALGGALGGGRGGEVVMVPGNHDHHLLSAWAEERARAGRAEPLGSASAIPVPPAGLLGELAERLRPARLRVSYPGVWLADGVYATHGHYLDRHTTVPQAERLAAGLMARLVGESAEGPARAEDYEAVLAPVYAWIHALAQAERRDGRGAAGGRGASARVRQALTAPAGRCDVRRAGLGLGFRGLIAALNHAGVGELRRGLSGVELRTAALLAIGEVAERLGLGPDDQLIFGHTHRAGPLPGDDPGEWRTGRGVRLINSGSWVDEPSFGGRDPGSPYRPGFGVVLETGAVPLAPPRLVNLLAPDPA